MKNRGYKDFDSKMNEVKKRLDSIKDLIDIAEYNQKINLVYQKYVQENKNHNTNFAKINLPNMQQEYDAFSYDKLINALETIASSAEKKVERFKKIKLLNSKITILLKEETINIDELTDTAKSLISTISLINFYDSDDKNNIIKDAYKNIYACLQIETLFGKKSILNHLKNNNNNADIHGVEKLIYEELDYNKMSIKEIVDSELANQEDKIVGQGYLNGTILLHLAKTNYPNLYKQYYGPKEEQIKNINNKIRKHNKKLEKLEKRYNAHEEEFKVIEMNSQKGKRLDEIILKTIPISLALVGATTGFIVASNSKEVNVDEVDLNNNQIINSYNEGIITNKHIEEPYNPMVVEYSPWTQTEDGYIRTVTRYSYEQPLDYNKIYDLSVEDIKNNLKEVESYDEEKSHLNITEDTNTSHIIIRYKSTKKISIEYKIVGAMQGMIGGLILYLLLLWIIISNRFESSPSKKQSDEDIIKIETKEDLEKLLAELNKEIREGKHLLEKREELKKTYGILEEELIYPKQGDTNSIKF